MRTSECGAQGVVFALVVYERPHLQKTPSKSDVDNQSGDLWLYSYVRLVKYNVIVSHLIRESANFKVSHNFETVVRKCIL